MSGDDNECAKPLDGQTMLKFIRAKRDQPVIINRIELDKQDFDRIIRNQWFNDNLLNSYLHLVEKYAKMFSINIYTFATYFYTHLINRGSEKIYKWVENVDLLSYNFIYIPIHRVNHWSFVNINVDKNEVEFWDSLTGGSSVSITLYIDSVDLLPAGVWNIVKPIMKFLFYYRKKKGLAKRSYSVTKMHCPQQPNGIDCGLFVCLYARYRMFGKAMPRKFELYHQRLKLCHELMKSKIIYPTGHVFKEFC